LAKYDYSQPGAYFVTICVEGKESILGNVINGEMNLSELGQIAAERWSKISVKYPHIHVDTHCIMPNHVHTIVSIHDTGRGEVSSPASQKGGETPPLRNVALGTVVAFYKYATTKAINELLDSPGTRFWQRNYYERIIRNERDYEAIFEYIRANPQNWGQDEYF